MSHDRVWVETGAEIELEGDTLMTEKLYSLRSWLHDSIWDRTELD